MINIILCILQIKVGRNIIFSPNGITGPEWTLEYINSTSFGLEFIIGGVVTGSVVVIILIAILLMVIIFLVKRTNSLKRM